MNSNILPLSSVSYQRIVMESRSLEFSVNIISHTSWCGNEEDCEIIISIKKIVHTAFCSNIAKRNNRHWMNFTNGTFMNYQTRRGRGLNSVKPANLNWGHMKALIYRCCLLQLLILWEVKEEGNAKIIKWTNVLRSNLLRKWNSQR